jgi:Secretion system C-terminal sorting domain
MQHKKIKLSAVLLLVLGLTGLQAQEAIPATGGNALGSGGSVSYSVGQVVYTTHTGTSGSAAQGVQQPFEISVVTGIEEAKDINLVCSAFPNPATDNVKLKAENYETENLTYQLYDIRGNLLENKKIEGNETSIVISNLVLGIYFLKVSNNNKEVKTFKIIKN